jgi:hypothetical protein
MLNLSISELRWFVLRGATIMKSKLLLVAGAALAS